MNESLIRNVPLFATIPSDELATLTSRLRQATYPAGTILMHEGDRGDRFYIVLSGQIAIASALGTLDERVLGVRGAGEFVGEMSLLNQDGLRIASAQVLSTAQVLELTRTDFDALLQRHPMMAYDMLRVLSTRMRDANSEMISDLQVQNQQLAQALADLQVQNQRLAQAFADLEAAQAQLVEKEALERELRLAREIQESILPRTLPHLPGADLGACMIPAREVAGDFFDAFAVDQATLGLVVGDVCGKGMPAAIFMALTRSLLRAEASRAETPEEALRNVNRHLLDMNAAGMFVTILYGIFRLDTGEFVYARAGHELPLVWSESGALQTVARAIGHPLGLLPDPALDVQNMRLLPGATLLLYTDGVTEAMDPRGDFFGLERLRATGRAYLVSPMQRLCDGVVDAVAAYRGTAPQADDITLLALHAWSAS
jgi:sigma-B regulation protein RsbU (phosphoserine phosphatase)